MADVHYSGHQHDHPYGDDVMQSCNYEKKLLVIFENLCDSMVVGKVGDKVGSALFYYSFVK